MKKIAAVIFSLFVILSFSIQNSFACTTFCLKNNSEVLFGKNYDWMIGDGLIFVNKRGVVKSATSENSPNPAKWTSKFGSVTFNQYGRENPSGGMNEAGLVIELMWLDETNYPKSDSRPTVGTLEWIQYQLDKSANLAEVLKNAENIVISSEVKIHYLVNDKDGNSATIEFIDGKLVAHTGEKLKVSALANDTFEKSWNYASETKDFGGIKETPQSASSFDRFTRAAQKAKEFEKQPKTEQEAVNYAFEILKNVEQKDYTQWSIVYDQKRSKIHFRSLQSPNIKTLETNYFDYSCGSVVRIFDVNSKESGDITTKFFDYTREKNRELIERSFNGTPFLKDIPAIAKNVLSVYPESFACQANEQKIAQETTNSGNFLTTIADVFRGIIGYIFGFFV